jgi:ubiquitin carboxyl-terminal hydrolase 25
MDLSRYSALGTPQDASDELVSFAYREQVRTNSREGPNYLTYLCQIAKERRSELLETLVATEYSAGSFDAEQLNDAYRYFALSPRDDGITDDLILGTFQARLQDAAMHEVDMREKLGIIGKHRQSQRIIDVAQDCKLVVALGFQDI